MPKPKSPKAPSRSLQEAFNFTKQLYEMYGHGSFSRPEIASTLGLSSASGPFNSLVATLKELGLVNAQGLGFTVTSIFMDLHTNPRDSQIFKERALEAVKSSKIFSELLTSFRSKLPDRTQVTHRLEREYRFTSKKARIVSNALEESLRFAGLLDSKNNILPAREDETQPDLEPSADLNGARHQSDIQIPSSLSNLRVEIPLSDNRRVIISYPPDITENEAEKIARILTVIVG